MKFSASVVVPLIFGSLGQVVGQNVNLNGCLMGSTCCVQDEACEGAGGIDQGEWCPGSILDLGTNTCIGRYSCKGAADSVEGSLRLDDGNSCIGEEACYEASSYRSSVTVMSGGCQGDKSCYQLGKSSYSSLTIGAGSCSESHSCYQLGKSSYSSFTIGAGSCSESHSCNQFANGGSFITLSIGTNSCTGVRSCDGVANTIGNDSCTCEDCCRCLETGDVVPDSSCNELGECCDGADGKTKVVPCAAAGVCNSGSCAVTGSFSYTCDCGGTGFEGEHCENDIDDCVGNSCANGSTCVDGINQYTCFCPPGFSGEYCETPNGQGGSAFGDPHISTWDGTIYDFMGACDTVFAKALAFAQGLGFEIQIRTQSRDDWSFVTGAAIKIGKDALEVQSNGNYYVNGVEGVDLFESSLEDYSLSWKMTRITADFYMQEFFVHLGTKGTVIIRIKKGVIDVSIADAKLEDFGDAEGLMGSFIGGELIGRDGNTVYDPITDGDNYGMEWQVRDTETNLFQSVGTSPQYPTKCIMPEEPKSLDDRRRAARRLGGRGNDFVTEAEEACASWPMKIRDACLYDVLASGDLDMALHHVDV